jgi:ABC-type bacteriocin/lantibiotic exporter with double-glycine peptidase domain
LSGADLHIKRGYSIGIIGSSGVGKSTLVNLVLGLLSPVDGVITVDGVDIKNQIQGWQRNIGYIPQQIYLLDDSIARNVALGVPDNEINIDRIWEVLEISQLKEFVSALPESLDTRIGELGICLSGGQRQRIGIARALYHDPQVLVLDEATSALDGETERSFMSAVAKVSEGKTLIIVAHRLSTLERCDAIYRIMKGKVDAVSDHHAEKQQEQR